MAGGNIINAIRFAATRAVSQGTHITEKLLREAANEEYRRMDRTVCYDPKEERKISDAQSQSKKCRSQNHTTSQGISPDEKKKAK
jgi:hypothetical protein